MGWKGSKEDWRDWRVMGLEVLVGLGLVIFLGVGFDGVGLWWC